VTFSRKLLPGGSYNTAVSVQYCKYYVGDNTKLSRKSENAAASNHVLGF